MSSKKKNRIPTASPLTMMMMSEKASQHLSQSQRAAKLNFIIQKQLFSRFLSPYSPKVYILSHFTWLEARIEAFYVVHLIREIRKRTGLKGFQHTQKTANFCRTRRRSKAVGCNLFMFVFSGAYSDKHRNAGRLRLVGKGNRIALFSHFAKHFYNSTTFRMNEFDCVLGVALYYID